MIGIKKVSYGRMGNRLFHYNFLRQIAKKSDIDYFHRRLPDSVYFENMEKKSRPFSPFKETVRLTSKDVLTFKPDEFLKYIAEEINKGKDILFDPPMVGEIFFDYLFYNPNEFVKIKFKYKKGFEFECADRKIIGVHFRGTDFPSWNIHAALKFSYYKAAIEFCLDKFGKDNPVLVLFTDDKNYQAYLETINYLRLNEISFYLGSTNDLPVYDFYQMTQCDILISSPSTFSIFAGCLGKPKKIIHDKNWLDYAISRNDIFWVKLSETSNSYYSLWKTF